MSNNPLCPRAYKGVRARGINITVTAPYYVPQALRPFLSYNRPKQDNHLHSGCTNGLIEVKGHCHWNAQWWPLPAIISGISSGHWLWQPLLLYTKLFRVLTCGRYLGPTVLGWGEQKRCEPPTLAQAAIQRDRGCPLIHIFLAWKPVPKSTGELNAGQSLYKSGCGLFERVDCAPERQGDHLFSLLEMPCSG